MALGRASLIQLQSALDDAAAALKGIIGDSTNPLSRERAVSLARQIDGLSRGLTSRLSSVTRNGRTITIRDIVAIHRSVNAALVKQFAGGQVTGLGARFDRLPARALTALAARTQNAALFETLIERRLTHLAPAVDRMIGSAVARGVPAQKLGKDLALLMEGQHVAYGDYGVTPRDVAGIRTVRGQAMTIARTEINNSAREANRQSLMESPIIYAATWQVSGRHAGLPSTPDDCDDLAEDNPTGLGPGVYLVEEWPLAPHPNCGCMQGGPIFYRPPSQWNQPMGPGDADEDL
jgi:hypothetical protein